MMNYFDNQKPYEKDFAQEVKRNEPVIPLPNPGEGGPVFDGSNEPVIPLPNPGEGGPVYGGDENENIPIKPLPNPGEGGPVYPGPIITVPVRPVIPCFFCNNNKIGRASCRERV